MDFNSKALSLFLEIYNNNSSFSKTINENLSNGKIRFFDDNEWDKIKNQNFVSFCSEIQEFIDMFLLGYNIGNCCGASRQLSYSYDDVDMVTGRFPILKGTKNAQKEGGHCWLETSESIIDTSLMLVIDKSLKNDFGYIEEQRLTAFSLSRSHRYQSRKEFVNDKNINNSKIKIK